MNGLDPNNNFGGGKVKFFTGGTGGGGQTIRLLPIMFGSNGMTTALGGGMLPLNSTEFFNDGVDTYEFAYADDLNATSYLPSIDNNYFYYITNGVITELNTNSVSVELELYIDGVVIEKIALDLNAGNSYTSLFAFSQTPNLNEYPVSRYGVRVNQVSGRDAQFVVSTTSVFLSVFDVDSFQSEFFTSSNLYSLKIFDISYNDFKFVGFGGQTNANSNPAKRLSSSVVSDITVIDLRKIYIMFYESFSGASGDLKIDLYINDTFVQRFAHQGNTTAFTPYVFTLTTPYTMSAGDTMYILLTNQLNTSVRIFEIGIYGYEITD